ncbi:MAG: hypothetical protein CME24_07545 [Gemmatimonadetes bacterium]|nr:hypothetical protein [Gemmatimonadota bacterium]
MWVGAVAKLVERWKCVIRHGGKGLAWLGRCLNQGRSSQTIQPQFTTERLTTLRFATPRQGALNAVDLMCRCMPQGASLTSAEQKPFTEELCKHSHRPTGLGLFQR